MKNINKYIARNEWYLIIIILVYSIIVTISNPAFLSLENFLDMLRASSGMTLLAMGILVVLLSGGIDLSFTAIAMFGGYTAATIMLNSGINNLVFMFAVSIGIGILLGAINALVIHFFRLPTMIATLGTLSFFSGTMITFIGSTNITPREMPSSIANFGSARIFQLSAPNGNIYGLSVFIIPVVICVILTWFILYKTMIGRSVVAMGNSIESATRAGFNLLLLRLFIFCYVGFLAGVMGVIFVAEVNWVNPVTLVGDELTYIAAVVIGGAKLTGGEGKIFGTLLGVAIVRLLSSTLVFLGLTSSWNGFFTGIILLLSVAFTSYASRIRSRRNLTFTD
jgi:simple sugar transport system permease protein